jgi:uncharacterized protein RhaS with RHS repeats
MYNQESIMSAVGSSVSYVYRAQNRRVKKCLPNCTSPTTMTDYFYSGSELIAEKTGSTWTDYIFYGDARIAQNTGATASTAVYLHTDHLGSTRVCTDASGNHYKCTAKERAPEFVAVFPHTLEALDQPDAAAAASPLSSRLA